MREEWRLKRAASAAAKRLGMSVEEYTARRAAGERWCSGCRDWHPEDEDPFIVASGYCRESYNRTRRELAALRRRRVVRQEQEFRRYVLARLLVK